MGAFVKTCARVCAAGATVHALAVPEIRTPLPERLPRDGDGFKAGLAPL
jgi:hypothetical protein